ncbi:MAG: hypothetical protein OEV00_12035 [Acidobacteriota bacterium]|nr:hypothetical protein [Acidobacteriota bacterium]MDH3786042.1 hypothetical protein [Acidobacteriota bacterium]
MRRLRVAGWILLVAALTQVTIAEERDERSLALANSVMEKMGGQEAWETTRFLQWDFFGGRTHHWDRYSGDVRIEATFEDQEYLFLMNINSRKGQVFKNGELLPEGEELDAALQQGYEVWVNDSYWMVMPYKLLDPGVSLAYLGERVMEDGTEADVVTMTFGDGIGVTPQNRYDLFIGKVSGLIEAWSFYADAADEEPRFTLPWADWKRFGKILLATSHGQDKDWAIAVHQTLDRTTFTDPSLQD